MGISIFKPFDKKVILVEKEKKNGRKEQFTVLLLKQYLTLPQQTYFSAHFCTWSDSASHQPLTLLMQRHLYLPLLGQAVSSFSVSEDQDYYSPTKLLLL